MAVFITWISLLGLVLVTGGGRLAETLEICKLTFFFYFLLQQVTFGTGVIWQADIVFRLQYSWRIKKFEDVHDVCFRDVRAVGVGGILQ